MFNKSADPTAKAAAPISELQKFSDIVQLIQNPQPLRDLLSEAEERAKLTAEETEKHRADRDYMAHVDEVRGGLENDRTALKEAQDKCREDEEAFRAWRQEEMARLHDEKEENEATQRRLEGDRQAWENEKAQEEQAHKDRREALDKAEGERVITASTNEKEKKRLARLAQKLEKQKLALKIALDDQEDEPTEPEDDAEEK